MDARIIEGVAADYLSRQGVECHVAYLLRKLLFPDRSVPVIRRRRHRAGRLERVRAPWRSASPVPAALSGAPGGPYRPRSTDCRLARHTS
ncbi:hypothetical protein [Streptomyces viridosporus]|uniref:hypothetical protein n=1 Tax=Streptomyces viridosporus TaxID=67581 RepID=UPI001180AB71|nr:hypothetical protein [Streptomyces viridosporus]